MFNNLSKNLIKLINKIKNNKINNDENIKLILEKIRLILIESDVVLKVVDIFIKKIKIKFKKYKKYNDLNLNKILIKIIKKELINILNYKNNNINLSNQKKSVILLIGLQGVGKTTTALKLSKLIKNKYKKKILLVSTDIYRPAAISQLCKLALKNNISFLKYNNKKDPIYITKSSLKKFKKSNYDILIIDTPGISYNNKKIEFEIKNIYNITKPVETLLILDSMMGQSSIKIPKFLEKILKITGIFLTKVDSDTKGGVALSVCSIMKKPIKFIGTGEHINNIEKFYPDRIVSRILGIGDLKSLMEEVKNKIDKEKSNKIINKIKYGLNFDLNDFLEQIQYIKNIGGIKSIIDKLPFLKNKKKFNEKQFSNIKNIINSMNKRERSKPNIIDCSRIRRISLGSGTTEKDVINVIDQFNYMNNMMKRIKGNNIKEIFKNLKNILPNNIKNLF